MTTAPHESAASDTELLNGLESICGFEPWIHEVRVITVEQKPILRVTMTDPEKDDGDDKITLTRDLTVQQIKATQQKALQGAGYMCCSRDIQDQGMAYGCAQDADTILQLATYDEVVYA